MIKFIYAIALFSSMLEHDISELDAETQEFLKKNPAAMLAYQIMGPPAPEPLSEEDYKAFENSMRERLEPTFEKLRIAAARSWIAAKYKVLD